MMRNPSVRRVSGTQIWKVSTTEWVVPELPENERLACSTARNYNVDPCVLMRPRRHHNRGAVGQERNLNKKMTRIGSPTAVKRKRNSGSP